MANDLIDAVVENPGHAVVGALVGQVLIPIPLVGAGIGAFIGGWVGKKNSERNQPPVPEAPPPEAPPPEAPPPEAKL